MAMQQLKSRVKRLYHRFLAGKPPVAAPVEKARSTASMSERMVRRDPPHLDAPPVHKRFLSNQPRRTEAFLQAAKDYVANMEPAHVAYLYEKPFTRMIGTGPGRKHHELFYRELYQVVNLLQAMEVPVGGRILEVGSGPGWVTEILLGLGYEVDALEPSEDLIRIAKDRVTACIQHHRFTHAMRVDFHCATLEDCPFPDNHFDGVFFHAALHHIIDEEKGLGHCVRVLKPGAVLGVSEASWTPGNRSFEDALEDEMTRFGTLENPFTIEYLDYLLAKTGFVDVTRYHSLNGLIPVEFENRTIKEMAQYPAYDSNTLTARKPDPTRYAGPTTADPKADTRGKIEILETRFDAAPRKLSLMVRLTNVGQTAWINKPGRAGCVGVGLYQWGLGIRDGRPIQPEQAPPSKLEDHCFDMRWGREAPPRQCIAEFVRPGKELVMDLTYYLAEDYDREKPWFLDLVSEQYYWFAKCGTVPARLTF